MGIKQSKTKKELSKMKLAKDLKKKDRIRIGFEIYKIKNVAGKEKSDNIWLNKFICKNICDYDKERLYILTVPDDMEYMMVYPKTVVINDIIDIFLSEIIYIDRTGLERSIMISGDIEMITRLNFMFKIERFYSIVLEKNDEIYCFKRFNISDCFPF